MGCKEAQKQEGDAGSVPETADSPMASSSDTLIYPGEKHFKSIRQVTFGGATSCS